MTYQIIKLYQKHVIKRLINRFLRARLIYKSDDEMKCYIIRDITSSLINSYYLICLKKREEKKGIRR